VHLQVSCVQRGAAAGKSITAACERAADACKSVAAPCQTMAAACEHLAATCQSTAAACKSVTDGCNSQIGYVRAGRRTVSGARRRVSAGHRSVRVREDWVSSFGHPPADRAKAVCAVTPLLRLNKTCKLVRCQRWSCHAKSEKTLQNVPPFTEPSVRF
jgi:hypothetical protein